MYEQFLIIKLAKLLLSKCCIFKRKIERLLPEFDDGTLECWDSYGDKTIFCNVKYNGKRTRVKIDPEWEGANPLIENLTEKAILIKGKQIMAHNIRALEYMLKWFEPYDPLSVCAKLGKAYDSSADSIAKTFMDGDIDPAAWQRAPYKKSSFHPEHLIFPTKGGEMVRSKSEAMIYDTLSTRSEIFRYECDLHLIMCNSEGRSIGQRTVSPDFTILRKSDRRILIHEHLGKMDDEDYVNRNMQKIDDYIAAGYIPGENLIITWETASMPFTLSKAVAAIDSYLGKMQ